MGSRYHSVGVIQDGIPLLGTHQDSTGCDPELEEVWRVALVWVPGAKFTIGPRGKQATVGIVPRTQGKKGRSNDLLRTLLYERALVYEELGHRKRARAEFEKLYAEAPAHEDVAARLGL